MVKCRLVIHLKSHISFIVFLYGCRCVFYLQIVILKHYVVVCVYAFCLQDHILIYMQSHAKKLNKLGSWYDVD